MRERADSALAKSASESTRAGAVAPVAPAAASVAAPRAAAPIAATAPAPATGEWTNLRLAAPGRTVEIERAQAGRLEALLDRMQANAPRAQGFDGAVSTRIELRRGEVLVASIEIAGARVRWTRWRDGQASVSVASPEPALLRELQEEIDRLLPR